MLLRLRLRIGAVLLIIGGLLATLGDTLSLWNDDPTASGWFLSMSAVVIGVLFLTHGINIYAQSSEEINFLGVISSGLLFLGGMLTIAGIIAINIVILPLLLSITATIAIPNSAPGIATQGATNTLPSGLQTLKNGILSIFGQHVNNADIPSRHIPDPNALNAINQIMDRLHLPSLSELSQWGHFFFSGGILTIGCLLMGLSLLRTQSFPRITSFVLVASAAINLIGQLCTFIFPSVTTITGVLFFATIAWFGISSTFSLPKRDFSHW